MPVNGDTKQGTAKTREAVKKERTLQQKKETATGKRRIRVRLIPIWMKIIIIFLLLVISLTAGTIVGYSVIGDGRPIDALKSSTWTHIIDLINKE